MKQFLLLALIAVPGFYWLCNSPRTGMPMAPKRAFYFWANEAYGISSREGEALDSLAIDKLYIKFFEAERDEALGIIPVAKTSLTYMNELGIVEVVPTVFIRNEIFAGSNEAELTQLADNISFLISKYYNERFTSQAPYHELQIDCDWTEKTRDKYFFLLKAIKGKIDVKLSATLRLYAYKFPERMGVLPVDRAMLMCYNLLSPRNAGDRNSILDLEELHKYLTGAEPYPKPLDVALPIYSMLQIYQNRQLAGIYYETSDRELTQLKKIDGFWYELQSDLVMGDVYARAGDRIKYERMSKKTIENAIALILDRVQFTDQPTVSFFHLNDTELTKYNYEELDHFYRVCHP